MGSELQFEVSGFVIPYRACPYLLYLQGLEIFAGVEGEIQCGLIDEKVTEIF